MKHLFLKLKILSVLTITCLLWACNKSPVDTPSQPASDDQSVNSATASAKVSPGIYKITKYLDEGKNETVEFNGYRFNFRSDGMLIARTDKGDRVEGTWKLNSKGTMMVIDISGKDELDKIDDDWIVVSITDMQISLRNSDADRVVFTRIN
jgi:hypothetical protein